MGGSEAGDARPFTIEVDDVDATCAELAARGVAAALLCMVVLGGCSAPPPRAGHAPYAPRTRAITITTIPLLVKESQQQFPFLARDFAPGGVLEGKEVYAFAPSTITAVEGDTLRLTILNPEDDAHNFALPGLSVPLPGQTITHATYVAGRAGIYPFVCNMPNHLPMMSGQLVVLRAGAVGEEQR